MNARTLLILLGVTLAVVAATALLLNSRSEAVSAPKENAKLFPALDARVNDVARIEVQREGSSTTLEKSGDRWVLAEKGGYPADLEPIKKLVLGLADMSTIEAKTGDPARYAKLGVDDPAQAGSTASRVTLKDAGGATLADVILGKPQEGKGLGGSGQTYVRKPSEAQSWLAKGRVEVKEKPVDWLAKEILKVSRDRVRAVTVEHADGEVVRVDRAKPSETNFTLHEIPEGKELSYPTVAGAIANALEWLNLEDVSPASAIDATTGHLASTRFETFDGLVVTVRTQEQDGKTWARFDAEFVAPAEVPADPAAEGAEATKDEAKKAPEEVAKEAAELDLRLEPWVFAIPAYNRSSFVKRKSEMLKDVAPPAPASDEPGAADGDGPFVIPGDLPPEIQDQIRAHQESLGNKTVVGPPRPEGDVGSETGGGDDHAGHDHDTHGEKPEEPKPPEPGSGDAPPPPPPPQR